MSRPKRADQPLPILKGPTFTARLEQICHGELPIERSLESFFKIGSIDLNEPTMAAQARAFLLAALYMTEISRRALDELRIDKVLLDGGKKTDWGIMRAIANQKGIPVDVTNTGLRGSSVRFIVDRPPNEPSLMGGWKRWRDESLTSAQEAELDAYLTHRATVPYEWRDEQWRLNIADEREVKRIVGLPDEPPGLVLAMFPNVGFDAGKTKSSTAAFATAAQWIEATIAVLAHENEHHLIIKSHPSEHHRSARDRIDHVVRRRYDPLPPNVHLIAPDADVTARSVAQLADIVLTYTSTVTVEAAAIGKPVILAGGGWHAGRGIATEVHTPSEYGALLEAILSGEHALVPATQLARRYAYALFFRNDIPIIHFQSNDFNVAQLCLDNWSDLAPGADRSLDAICRGVLLDEPFENPLTQHNALTGVGAGMSER